MKEPTLRKYHRYAGVSIALLVFVQAGSGLLLSMNMLIGSNFLESSLSFLHFGDGVIGNVYRIILAAILLFMAATGVWIHTKILARSAAAHSKRSAG
jgi:hypothetical protein